MGSDLLSWQTGYGNLNSTFDYGVGIGGLGFSGFGTMNMPKDGLVSKNYNPADSADLGGNGGANDVEISNEIIFLLSGSNISLNPLPMLHLIWAQIPTRSVRLLFTLLFRRLRLGLPPAVLYYPSELAPGGSCTGSKRRNHPLNLVYDQGRLKAGLAFYTDSANYPRQLAASS